MAFKFTSRIAFLCAVIFTSIMPSSTFAQNRQEAPKWTFKAVMLADHPEIATKELNELAAAGWQYVGPVSPRCTAFKRIEPAVAQPKVGAVTGTITLDGKPLAKGTIQFIPIGVKLPVITANIVDGKYTADVAAGKMKVSISVQKAIGGKRDAFVEMIPAKYNESTQLTFEAVPGVNRLVLDLRSK